MTPEERNAVLARHGITGPMKEPLNASGACVDAAKVAEIIVSLEARAVPAEGDRERLARIIDVALADAAQHNGSYDWDWYAEPAVYNRLADHLLRAGVSLTGSGLREALTEALDVLDFIEGFVSVTHPEGDGCPLCGALAALRGLLEPAAIAREYAALSGESGEPTQ